MMCLGFSVFKRGLDNILNNHNNTYINHIVDLIIQLVITQVFTKHFLIEKIPPFYVKRFEYPEKHYIYIYNELLLMYTSVQ